jgi:hypothetical protein
MKPTKPMILIALLILILGVCNFLINIFLLEDGRMTETCSKYMDE